MKFPIVFQNSTCTSFSPYILSSSHLLAFVFNVKIKSLQLILPLYSMSQFLFLLANVCILQTVYTIYHTPRNITHSRLSLFHHYKVNNLINSCSIISTQKLFTICIIVAHTSLWMHDMKERKRSHHDDDDCIVGIKIIMFMRLTQISNYDYSRGASGIEVKCIWSSLNNWVI